MVAAAAGAIGWLLWRSYAMARGLGAARQQPFIDQATGLWFGLCTAAGALALGVLNMWALLQGVDPDDRILRNSHALDAFGLMLLGAGLALIVAAVVLFPPGGLVLAGGLVTLEAGSAAVAGTGLAVAGLSLHLAASQSPSGGRPGPPLDPTSGSPGVGFILGIVGIAAVDRAAGLDIFGADTPNDPIVVPTPSPYQYTDPNGQTRWRDTNQLVDHNPNRTIYQDDDNTWRWTDTNEPVDGRDAATGSAEMRPAAGGDGSVRENQLPDRLDDELATADRLDVAPVEVGSPGFMDIVNEGTLKYAVLGDGRLVVQPYAVDGEEISHAVLSGGDPVHVAGHVDVVGGGGEYIGLSINANSGHFGTGNIEIATEAFERYGITFD